MNQNLDPISLVKFISLRGPKPQEGESIEKYCERIDLFVSENPYFDIEKFKCYKDNRSKIIKLLLITEEPGIKCSNNPKSQQIDFQRVEKFIQNNPHLRDKKIESMKGQIVKCVQQLVNSLGDNGMSVAGTVGFAAGAATGAAIGVTAGPIGAAIGALIGGAYVGLTAALTKSTAKNINDMSKAAESIKLANKLHKEALEYFVLPKNFTQEQLEAARKAKYTQYHPDLWVNSDEQTKKMKGEALLKSHQYYEILSGQR